MKIINQLSFFKPKSNTITVLKSKDMGIIKKLANQLALECQSPFELLIIHVPTSLPSNFLTPLLTGVSGVPYGYKAFEVIDKTSIYETVLDVMLRSSNHNSPYLISVLDMPNIGFVEAFCRMKHLMNQCNKSITLCIFCNSSNIQLGRSSGLVDYLLDMTKVNGEVVLNSLILSNANLSHNPIRLIEDISNQLYPYHMSV